MKKKIIAAGGLVTNRQNDLLMIYRRKKWDLPKGKLDNDETIEQCALREVMEETGLKHVMLKHFVSITYHEYYDEHKKENVVKETHWFAMKAIKTQKLVPQTEEDIEKIQWADRELIKQLLTNSYTNIIEVVNAFYKLL